MDEFARLLREQGGVVARRQLLAMRFQPSDLARMQRRRELSTVHPGVFVDHTGPLAWLQRAWAAVLFSWPAALSHGSAMRAAEGPGRRGRDDTQIHVGVEKDRHLVAPRGVVLHRMTGFDGRVQWNLGPPRVRYDEVVLDVASESSSELDAIATLADACGARRTPVPACWAAQRRATAFRGERGCSTAAKLALLMRRRGWVGTAHSCDRCG